MEDAGILALYFARDEQALAETQKKYGPSLFSVSYQILRCQQDAEECVNDTYLSAWNSMPPHRPRVLSVFLGKLTRNLSLNRYKYNTALKRGSGQAAFVLDEIAELVSDTNSVEREIVRRELVAAIDAFLGALPADKRRIFVCRYWYFDTIPEIAARFGMTGNHVSVTLSRLRLKLRKHLSERGFEL